MGELPSRPWHACGQRQFSAVSTRALLQAHLSEGCCPLFFPSEGTARSVQGPRGSRPLRQAAGRLQRLMNFGVTRGLARIWEPRALIRAHGPALSKAQPFHPAADLWRNPIPGRAGLEPGSGAPRQPPCCSALRGPVAAPGASPGPDLGRLRVGSPAAQEDESAGAAGISWKGARPAGRLRVCAGNRAEPPPLPEPSRRPPRAGPKAASSGGLFKEGTEN